MDSSWLSETSSEIVNYLYEHITPRGDEETARAQASSSLQAALSKGIWITDLPANDFEPLENSPMAKEVSVFFLLPFFAMSNLFCCITRLAIVSKERLKGNLQCLSNWNVIPRMTENDYKKRLLEVLFSGSLK